MNGKVIDTNVAIKKIICYIIFLILAVQFTFATEIISNAVTFEPGTDFTRGETSEVFFNGSQKDVTVKGFISFEENDFLFYNGLTFTFNEPDTEYFNRFTIEYSADACIAGTIYYKVGTTERNEEFFLESGENASFSSLIDGYLDSEVAHSVTKITLSAKSKLTAHIKIESINTVVYNVFKEQTAYIENDRFKLGCCLIWGGGLNYIEDKKDNDPTVANMLNHCDTGRLVQQSYYGTTQSPYVAGHYNGSVWAYNPVQGGDQYGNKSKLVDFSINKNTIYVKCRPRDWSKNNQYALSYMENVYTLEEDCIKVDNRFIDFSGYDHGTNGKHQELPAFYTISYLDTFTFYNGNKPWIGDTLTVKNNLPFWGDAQNQSKCYFNLDRENSETWCAWTSSEKGYGLGIYTPDVNILLAGRHTYNGSKNPSDGATNYVAPLITTIMRNYEPFQYSYYITSGTVDTIRSTFTEKQGSQTFDEVKQDTTNLTFEQEDEISVFSGENEVDISYSKKYGAALFEAPDWSKDYTGRCDSNAYIRFADQVNTKDYRYLVMAYMMPETNVDIGYQAEFFVCAGSRKDAEGGYSYRESMISDGNVRYMIIDMWDVVAMNGSLLWPASGEVLNAIRLDFDGAFPNDKLYILGFGLTGSKELAQTYADSYIKTPESTGSNDSEKTDTSLGTNIVIPEFLPEATAGVATYPDIPSGSPTDAPSATPTETPTDDPSTPTPPATTFPVFDKQNNQTNKVTPDSSLKDDDDYDDNETESTFIVVLIAGGTLIVAVAIIIIVVAVKNRKAAKEKDSDLFI